MASGRSCQPRFEFCVGDEQLTDDLTHLAFGALSDQAQFCQAGIFRFAWQAVWSRE